MEFRTIWLTGCLAFFSGAMSLNATADPVLEISVYAPMQKDSPARIIGFAYDDPPAGKPYSFLQFTIQSASSKPVVGVQIESRAIAPPGCGERFVDGSGLGSVHYPIRLLPNERKSVLYDSEGQGVRSGFDPAFFGLHAKDLKTAYLQIQFRVGEVDLADGTKWEVPGRFVGPHHAFDSPLASTDSVKCSDADGVARTTQALKMIEEWRVRTDGNKKLVPNRETVTSDLPQVHIRCDFEDKLAICSSPK